MSFPENFVWESGSSAYQVEGAAFEDGKGLCVWDKWCHQDSKIHDPQRIDFFARYLGLAEIEICGGLLRWDFWLKSLLKGL